MQSKDLTPIAQQTGTVLSAEVATPFDVEPHEVLFLIDWQAWGSETVVQVIEYSPDGGKSWQPICTAVSGPDPDRPNPSWLSVSGLWAQGSVRLRVELGDKTIGLRLSGGVV